MSVRFAVEETLDHPLDVCLEHMTDYWVALGVGSRLVKGRNRTTFKVVSERYALFPVTGDVRLRSRGRGHTTIVCQGVVDIMNFPFASKIAGEVVKRGIRNGGEYIDERISEVA